MFQSAFYAASVVELEFVEIVVGMLIYGDHPFHPSVRRVGDNVPDLKCAILSDAEWSYDVRIIGEDFTPASLPAAYLDVGVYEQDILLEAGLGDEVQQFLAVLLLLEVFLPQLLDVLIGIDLHPVLQEYGVEVLAFIFCLHNRKFRNKIAIKLLICLVLLHKSCYFCCRMKESPSYYRVCCPNCGKYMKVRILELEGVLRLSLHCPSCKQQSTIELKDIKAQE